MSDRLQAWMVWLGFVLGGSIVLWLMLLALVWWVWP